MVGWNHQADKYHIINEHHVVFLPILQGFTQESAMVRTDISLTSPELTELPQGTMVNVVEVVLAAHPWNFMGYGSYFMADIIYIYHIYIYIHGSLIMVGSSGIFYRIQP